MKVNSKLLVKLTIILAKRKKISISVPAATFFVAQEKKQIPISSNTCTTCSSSST